MDGRRDIIYISESEQIEGIKATVRAKGWSKSDVLREVLKARLRQNGI
jgi:hypothetical protein